MFEQWKGIFNRTPSDARSAALGRGSSVAKAASAAMVFMLWAGCNADEDPGLAALNRCGPDFAEAVCGENRCCSVDGFCGGLTEPHCGESNGFNGLYDGPVTGDSDAGTDVGADGSSDTTSDVDDDTAPDVGTDTPDVGDDTSVPDVGEDTSVPDVGEDTSVPDVGDDTAPDTTDLDRCGPDHGDRICDDNQCCSADGMCGELDEPHCTYERGFAGDYDGDIVERADGACGPFAGESVCGENRCCSLDGACSDLGDDACMVSRGFYESYDGVAVEREDHRCGPDFEDGACDPNRCCSSAGYCGGLDETHCTSTRGFDGAYDGDIVERSDHRCGPDFEDGICDPNRCCSSAGYCGNLTQSHCSATHGFDGAYDGVVGARADSRCGPDAGGGSCGANRCCSTAGVCGDLNEAACTDAHGFDGAYDGEVGERVDSRCGPDAGGASCDANRCCSADGFCGDLNEPHCSDERGFDGTYDGEIVERDDHRCGPDFEEGICDPNRCCSTAGYCGGLDEIHCNETRGFDGAYDGQIVERADHRCGPDFEAGICDPNRCCSSAGYCGGLTQSHCNETRGFDGAYDGERTP